MSRILGRGAQADAHGAARCFLQVLYRVSQPLPVAPLVFFVQILHRGAQVVAATPRRCRRRTRTNLLMCCGKNKFYPHTASNYPGARHHGCANCSPAVASRRAENVDEFRVPTLLVAQPRSHNLFSSRCTTFFRWLFEIILGCSRGEGSTSHHHQSPPPDPGFYV